MEKWGPSGMKNVRKDVNKEKDRDDGDADTKLEMRNVGIELNEKNGENSVKKRKKLMKG